MEKKRCGIVALERARRIAEGVEKWMRQRKEKRISIKKLCENLHASRQEVRSARKKPNKKVEKASEKLKLVRKFRAAAKKFRPDSRPKPVAAAKVVQTLVLKHTGLRTVQRVQKPFRESLRQRASSHWREVHRAMDEEAQRRALLPLNHRDHPSNARWSDPMTYRVP